MFDAPRSHRVGRWSVRRHVPPVRQGAAPSGPALLVSRPDVAQAIESAIEAGTKMVWVRRDEPDVKLADIAAIAAICKRKACCSRSTTRSHHRCCSAPLELGADIVMHSNAKYSGGTPTSSAVRSS